MMFLSRLFSGEPMPLPVGAKSLFLSRLFSGELHHMPPLHVLVFLSRLFSGEHLLSLPGAGL